MSEILRESPTLVCFQEVVPETLVTIRERLDREYEDPERGVEHT